MEAVHHLRAGGEGDAPLDYYKELIGS